MNKTPDQKQVEDSRKAYSDSSLMQKISEVAKSAGISVMQYVLLLWEVLKADTTPTTAKAAIVGALGYFIIPMDLIPDLLSALGYADDVAALAAVFKTVRVHITPEVREKAENRLKGIFGQDATINV